MAALDALTADFESFAVGSNPSGVAASGTSWHRVNANRTLIVNDNVNPRRGTRCCWIERRAGDIPNPPNVGNRTEFYDGRAVLENSDTGHDAYYATSVYLPNGSEPWGRSDPAWEPGADFAVIWQVHQQDSIAGSPPIGLHADRYWSTGNEVSIYLHIRGGNPGSPSTQDLFFTWNEEIRGQWLDLIWRVKYATNSTGLVQGWIRRQAESAWTAVHDGQPGYIFGTWTNIPTAFTGDTASYRKGGIYKGTDTRQTIYHHGYVRTLTLQAAQDWFTAASADQVITPDFIASSSQVFFPSVVAPPEVIAPTLVGPTGQVFAPALGKVAAQTATPSLVASTAEVFEPTLATVPSGAVTPSFITSTAQVFEPAVANAAAQTITPDLLASEAVVPFPVVANDTPAGGGDRGGVATMIRRRR